MDIRRGRVAAQRLHVYLCLCVMEETLRCSLDSLPERGAGKRGAVIPPVSVSAGAYYRAGVECLHAAALSGGGEMGGGMGVLFQTREQPAGAVFGLPERWLHTRPSASLGSRGESTPRNS